ncbi:hypothetical protein ACWDSJ_36990 [Nocardia sp. NPDC003482]
MKYTLSSILHTDPGGRIVVLHGIAGGGKSALALWLAMQARDHGVDVHWIRADDVRTSMVAVAAAYGMDEHDRRRARSDDSCARDLAWRHLDSANRPWLLIFDNIDDLRGDGLLGRSGDRYDGTGWIRQSNAGLVVVTTRRGDQLPWGDVAELHRVEVLDGEAGAGFLCELAPGAGAHDDAIQLSFQLGGLPLALRLAGSYLASPLARYRSFTAYSAALRTDLELLDAGEPLAQHFGDEASARRSVRLTWELSLRLLESHGQAAARPLLQLLCCFGAPHPIPLELLSTGPELTMLGPPVAELSQTAVDRTVQSLQTYAMVDHPDRSAGAITGACVTLHPLLAEVVSASCDQTHDAVPIWRCAASLLRRFAPETTEPGDRERWRLLPPMCRHLLERAPVEPDDILTTTIDIGNECAAYLIHTGALRDAHAMSTRTVDRLAHLSKRKSEYIELRLKTRYVAATVNFESGNVGVVCGELRTLLNEARQTLPPRHSGIIAIQQKLALALATAGSSAESERLYRELLDNHAADDGSQQELATRFGYARLLDSMGRFDEAERQLRTVLSALRAIDRAHSHSAAILAVRTSLASVWAGQGSLDQARNELTQILEAQEQLYGPASPLTLTTRMTLMATLRGLLDTDAADAQLSQMLRIQRDALNPEHPFALISYASLIGQQASEASEDPIAIEHSLLVVADTMARVTGENNPIVLGIRARAAAHRAAHDPVGAEQVVEDLLDTQTPLLASTHPSMLAIRKVHALLVAKSGQDNPRAQTLLLDLLRDNVRAVGNDVPQTIDVRIAVAHILRRNGDLAGCTEQLRESIAALQRLFGPNHEKTWPTRAILVQILCEQERFTEAAQELDSLVQSTEAAQPDSANFLQPRLMRAQLRFVMGEIAEAEEDLRTMLSSLQSLPGREYEIQIMRWLLCDVVRADGGRHAEAEELLTDVASTLTELDDPGADLVMVRLELGELLHERGKPVAAERQLQLALAGIPDEDLSGPVATRAQRGLSIVAQEIAAIEDSPGMNSAGLQNEETSAGHAIDAVEGGHAERPVADVDSPDGGSSLSYIRDAQQRPRMVRQTGRGSAGPMGGDQEFARTLLGAGCGVPAAPGVSATPDAISSDLRLRLLELQRARDTVRDVAADMRLCKQIAELAGRRDRPEVDRAYARHRYGQVLCDLGFPAAARGWLTAALAGYRRLGSVPLDDQLECMVDAALLEAALDTVRARTPRLADVHTHVAEALGPTHHLVLRLRRGLTELLLAPHDSRAAREQLSDILAEHRRSGYNLPETASVLAALASEVSAEGDIATATQLYDEALAILGEHLPGDHPRILVVRAARAAATETTRYTAAVSQLTSVLNRQLLRRGRGHPEVADTRVRLARCLADDDKQLAQQQLQAAIRSLQLRWGAGHPSARAAVSMAARIT